MKRANGEGSIEVLPNGKARVRYTVRGRRRSKTFANEETARRMLAAVNVERAAGAIVDPDALTLRTFGAEWLDDRELHGNKRGRAVRDIRTERSIWTHHVERARFIDEPLSCIRTVDVEDWTRELARSEALQTVRVGSDGSTTRATGRTLSVSTIRHALRILRQCLDRAVALEHIARNPAAGVSPPHDPEADARWTFLEASEIERVASLSEPHRSYFLTAIYTGVRQAELWRLRWADVDLDRAQLTVREGAKGTTKSGKTRRAPLLPAALAVLRAHREASKRTGARDFVFSRPDGHPFAPSYDGGWEDKRERSEDANGKPCVVVWPGWKTEAGIARDVRFHDLRHTCASHLVQGTWGRAWRLEEVRDFLGHSSIKVTERYAHLGPASIARAARETVAALPPVGRVAPLRPPADPPQPPEILGAPPRGLEPLTRCLEARGSREASRGLGPPQGQRAANALEAARAVLGAAMTGNAIAGDAIDALAGAVLDSAPRAVRLALEIASAEPERVARLAIELAALVLAEAPAEQSEAGR